MTDLPPGLHGAHLRADLLKQIGLPAVRSLLRVERLVVFSRHVYVDRERTLGFLTRAAAALLTVGPRAVLTGHSAAFLYGCTAADTGMIHVLSGYDRQLRRRGDLMLHQGSFEEQDVAQLNGLRVLGLERVIADLLCTAPRGTALACADQAIAGQTPPLRAEFKAEISHRIQTRPDPRGRLRGGVLLLLATGAPESPAESRLLLALFDAGLPVPELQYPVCDLDAGSATGSISRGRSRWSPWSTTAMPRMLTEPSETPSVTRTCAGGAGSSFGLRRGICGSRSR